MIAGTYGFTCSGIAPTTPSATTTIPIALIGIVKSNGEGTFYGPATANFGGNIMEEYLTTDGGKKSELDPDCTGTIEYQMYTGDPNATDSSYLGTLPIRFVVVDDGNEINGMPTAPGLCGDLSSDTDQVCELVGRSENLRGATGAPFFNWCKSRLFAPGGLGGDDHAGDLGVGGGGNDALGLELGLVGIRAASDDFS